MNPCQIKNKASLNGVNISYCLDTDSSFTPPGIGAVEDDFQIPMQVTLMGDYDLNNQVDEVYKCISHIKVGSCHRCRYLKQKDKNHLLNFLFLVLNQYF